MLQVVIMWLGPNGWPPGFVVVKTLQHIGTRVCLPIPTVTTVTAPFYIVPTTVYNPLQQLMAIAVGLKFNKKNEHSNK